MEKEETSNPSSSADEDVSLDDELPFDRFDSTPEPEQPTWIWARLPSADPNAVVWRRYFAGEEPDEVVERLKDSGDLPGSITAVGPSRSRVESSVEVRPLDLGSRSHPAPAPDAAPEEPAAIKVEEAAGILGIDRNTLYAMLKRGEGPPARRCGTGYRLDRAAVREWLRAGDPPPSRRRRAG